MLNFSKHLFYRTTPVAASAQHNLRPGTLKKSIQKVNRIGCTHWLVIWKVIGSKGHYIKMYHIIQKTSNWEKFRFQRSYRFHPANLLKINTKRQVFMNLQTYIKRRFILFKLTSDCYKLTFSSYREKFCKKIDKKPRE